MATVTIHDVYNALGLTAENGTQTLINSIRNSTELGGITQLYDGTVEGLRDFGTAVNRTSRHQNIFVNELVDRIGMTIISQVDLQNPLKRFKKGRFENGRMIEEVFADLVKAQSFNPEDASQTVFKRNPPNVRVLFHDNWRKELYPTTIEETTLRQAFTSFEAFENFVTQVYGSLYNSNEVDEYLWTHGMIESYVANGFAHYVQVPNVTDETSAKEFTKKVRAVSSKLTLPQGSRSYNASGVHTRTPKDRVWIMIDADLNATLDVDVLARAFNMTRTQIENQTILVENFALTGLQAVMFDEDVLKIYDKEFRLNSIENPKGLYWNAFLHVHQMFSMGKFQNVVAFMSDSIPLVTKLYVTPLASYVRLNESKVLDGFMELKEGKTAADVAITATITGDNGVAITGATVNAGTPDGNKVPITVNVTNKDLVDQNLTVNLTVTEKTPEDEGTPFVRTASAIVIPLPQVEG